MSLAAVWSEVRQRPRGWYWMANQFRHGDLFQACTLIPAFRDTHGGRPLYVVVSSESEARVVRPYKDYVAEIIIEPALAGSAEEWDAFYAETGLPRFGPDTPILLHLTLSRELLRYSSPTAANLGVNQLTVYKHVLHLPGSAEPTPPPVSESLRRAAEELCAQHDMPAGRSVLLFPFSVSLRAQAAEHWVRLAEALAEQGWAVFTSVAPGETPIAGAPGVFIPFDLLSDVADHCGWVVGVRSGVGDILAFSRCRKTWIYPDFFELCLWNPRELGMARDAYEFAFSPQLGSPEGFCTAVLTGRTEDSVCAREDRVPGMLMPLDPRSEVIGLEFKDAQRAPGELARWVGGALGDLPDAPRLVVLTGMVPNSHTRWTELRQEMIAAVLHALGDRDLQIFACRASDRMGWYEELDRSALLGAYHRAARYWHTILITTGSSLRAFLPAAAADRIVVLEPVQLDEQGDFSQLSGSPAAAEHSVRGLPLNAGGFELTEGWSHPESWGAWSLGRRAVLRFALAEPATGALQITLGVYSCLSQSFPRFAFSVAVNGLGVGSFEITWPEHKEHLEFVAPASVTAGVRNVWVEFTFDEVRSPTEQGHAADGRVLGIGMVRAQVTAALDEETPAPTAPAPGVDRRPRRKPGSASSFVSALAGSLIPGRRGR